jgi:hypothetical protein
VFLSQECDRDFETYSGFRLRLVEANSSSSCSLIELYISFALQATGACLSTFGSERSARSFLLGSRLGWHVELPSLVAGRGVLMRQVTAPTNRCRGARLLDTFAFGYEPPSLCLHGRGL